MQYRNFLSAQRLAQVFDLSKYDSVLELGCGEMVQAFVIKKLYPHLRYCASDFDPYIIKKCSSLPLLSNIEKRVIDVMTLNASDLLPFQLVLSWELLYALDDEKMLRLFSALGAARVSMIAATTQLTGPLRAIIRWLKGIPFREGGDQKSNRKGLRMHGWHHSLGYFEHLSKKFCMKLERVWYPNYWKKTPDNFTFLFFSARS